jgi:hypothetical protein
MSYGMILHNNVRDVKVHLIPQREAPAQQYYSVPLVAAVERLADLPLSCAAL